jgi:hypothetical protein
MRIETDSPTLEFYIWSSIQQKIMVPTSMEFLAKNKKKIVFIWRNDWNFKMPSNRIDLLLFRNSSE